MFQYTLHVPCATLEAKTDNIIIRRGTRGYSLLAYLFLTANILKVNSETLTELLNNEKMKLPKNSTRKAKITSLAKAATVEEHVPPEVRSAIEKKLEEEEANRRKVKSNEANNDEECDDEQAAELHVSMQTNSNMLPTTFLVEGTQNKK